MQDWTVRSDLRSDSGYGLQPAGSADSFYKLSRSMYPLAHLLQGCYGRYLWRGVGWPCFSEAFTSTTDVGMSHDPNPYIQPS